MSSENKLKNIFSRIFTGRKKWITIACVIVIVCGVSTVLAYNYIVNLKMKEVEDMEMLLDLLEKEIKESEENRSIGPPMFSRDDIQEAKALLTEARRYLKSGDRQMAWLRIRELMFLFRKSVPPMIDDKHPLKELTLRSILISRLERAKHWLNIFKNISEKTTDESVKTLLQNSTNTLEELIREAGDLIDKGLYDQARNKLDEVFKIINETLVSLRVSIPPPCLEKPKQAPPHFSY